MLEVDPSRPIPKADLIRDLVLAVRASRCVVLFAMGMQAYVPVPGMTQDEAIRRGAAMRSEHGVMRWNWQKLERDHAENVLTIDTSVGTRQVYRTQGSGVDKLWGYRPYKDRGELLALVLGFMKDFAVGASTPHVEST